MDEKCRNTVKKTNIVVKGSVKMCSIIFQQPFLSMPKFGMLPEKARVKSDH